jgi:hypothetical protein
VRAEPCAESAEPKSLVVELRTILLIGMHPRHKPTFPSLQTQLLAKGSQLCAPDLSNWNTIQHGLFLKENKYTLWIGLAIANETDCRSFGI